MIWLQLIAEEQLMDVNLLSQKSSVKAIVLLKHSTRCSISTMALNRLERSWKLPEKEVPTYILDLLNYRGISAKIEKLYGVMHESPQILVIKNGKCIYTSSHSDINVPAIEAAINS
mgnify:CR=1 FL=1